MKKKEKSSGGTTSRRMRIALIDWMKVDWTKSDERLAKIYGVAATSVGRCRRKVKRSLAGEKVDWSYGLPKGVVPATRNPTSATTTVEVVRRAKKRAEKPAEFPNTATRVVDRVKLERRLTGGTPVFLLPQQDLALQFKQQVYQAITLQFMQNLQQGWLPFTAARQLTAVSDEVASAVVQEILDELAASGPKWSAVESPPPSVPYEAKEVRLLQSLVKNGTSSGAERQ